MDMYKSVVLDVDSTVVTIEGLVEIAKRKNVSDDVLEITNNGMNGSVLFSESLHKRLDIVKPSRDDLVWLGKQYVTHVTLGAKELVAELRSKNISVYLISGAFYEALEGLATVLNIPDENIIAVTLEFDENDVYVGFDTDQILLQDQGKLRAIQERALQRRIAMIGDGLTDLETSAYVDTFIGYGGVVERDVVRDTATIYTNSPNLRDVLQLL